MDTAMTAPQANSMEIPGLINLKAGPELDAVIAYRVMNHVGDTDNIPKYSTDETQAFEVVKMLARDYKVEVKKTSPTTYFCEISMHDEHYESDVGAESESAAEAICLAAIEAITSL